MPIVARTAKRRYFREFGEGECRPIRIRRIGPVRSGQGVPEGMCVLARSVTENKMG